MQSATRLSGGTGVMRTRLSALRGGSLRVRRAHGRLGAGLEDLAGRSDSKMGTRTSLRERVRSVAVNVRAVDASLESGRGSLIGGGTRLSGVSTSLGKIATGRRGALSSGRTRLRPLRDSLQGTRRRFSLTGASLTLLRRGTSTKMGRRDQLIRGQRRISTRVGVTSRQLANLSMRSERTGTGLRENGEDLSRLRAAHKGTTGALRMLRSALSRTVTTLRRGRSNATIRGALVQRTGTNHVHKVRMNSRFWERIIW